MRFQVIVYSKTVLMDGNMNLSIKLFYREVIFEERSPDDNKWLLRQNIQEKRFWKLTKEPLEINLWILTFGNYLPRACCMTMHVCILLILGKPKFVIAAFCTFNPFSYSFLICHPIIFSNHPKKMSENKKYCGPMGDLF